MTIANREERETPLLLTIEEAASLLRASRSKVYQLAATGELPGVVRIGRSVRIRRAALEQWGGTGGGAT